MLAANYVDVQEAAFSHVGVCRLCPNPFGHQKTILKIIFQKGNGPSIQNHMHFREVSWKSQNFMPKYIADSMEKWSVIRVSPNPPSASAL